MTAELRRMGVDAIISYGDEKVDNRHNSLKMGSIMKLQLWTILLFSLSTMMAFAKDSQTYYTSQRVEVARDNVQKYEWAKAFQKRIVETGDPISYFVGPKFTSANDYAAQTDDFIWLLQPPTTIDRLYPESHETMRLCPCPVHWLQGQKYDVWCAWKIDPINHPYQIQCMVGKEWYPSNAYHEGDFTSGQFADDGNGFEYEGKRYYPLIQYAHMVYGSVVVPTLSSLSQAYLLTGDRRYARKGTILLARLASEYPNYEDRIERTWLKGKYSVLHTWEQGGMITDLIWETFLLEATAYAYDGLYDYMDTDPETIAYLKGKGLPINNADDLRRFIEKNLFRHAMQALLDKRIRGNEGHHQAAALACALVMDDFGNTHPNSKDMVDYAYHGIGQAAYHLVNGLTREGGGHESPGYNTIKADFVRVATLMEELRIRYPDTFPLDEYPDIFAEPKAKGLFDFNMDMLLMDDLVPDIGDCGRISSPVRRTASSRKYSFLGGTPEKDMAKIFAFTKYGYPRYARACTTCDGEILPGNIWEYYPVNEIKKALEHPDSQIVRKTRLLDGYGMGILESGTWPKSRALVLNYTRLFGHRQHDPLTIFLMARGVNLLPDMGYPETWKYRFQWDSNAFAHNTVVVNETQPTHAFYPARASLFASIDGVHLISANTSPYPAEMPLGSESEPPVDLYERTVLMIDIDEDRFYVVDLFAVAGGSQHDQSWHGMLVKPNEPNLPWAHQPTGTLAGEKVERYGKWTDRWRRQRDDFPSYIKDVRRAGLAGPEIWQWPSGLPEGDALNLHVVPVHGQLEVITGSGTTPARGNEYQYVLLRRQVEKGAQSLFLSVLEPFQNSADIQSVRLLSSTPVILEVVRTDAKDIVTLNIPAGPGNTTAFRPLGVAFKSETAGEVTRDVQVGSLGSWKGPGYARGTITRSDYSKNKIVIKARPGDRKKFQAGGAIRIYNDLRSAMFTIVAVKHRVRYVELTLDKNALMAKFPVTGQNNGVLSLGSSTPFSHSGLAGLYYQGCWVGNDTDAQLIQSLQASKLTLSEPLTEENIKQNFVGKVVSIWHYGATDKVEAVLISSQ
jgi:hypothetical protein